MPGATAASWCQGVASGATAATNTQCDYCFAWGDSSKAYAGASAGNCMTALSTGLITDCQYYNGRMSNTLSNSMPNKSSCIKCKKTYYNLTTTASGANFAGACSADQGSGCSGKIDNCLQTVCYTNYDGTTAYSSSFCNYCKNGYMPANIDIWDQGATKCEKGTTPDNCIMTAASTSQNTNGSCMACKKNFALNSFNTCIAFTTDENCHTLSSADEGCMRCWNAYYFSTSTCTLKSNLAMAGILALMGLIAWFN